MVFSSIILSLSLQEKAELLFMFRKQERSAGEKEGGFYEIFRVLEEKQRFSTGIQAWNITVKSVSGDVCTEESVQ